jgi:hypothetical protein
VLGAILARAKMRNNDLEDLEEFENSGAIVDGNGSRAQKLLRDLAH